MPTAIREIKFTGTIANGQTTVTVAINVPWSGFVHRLMLKRTGGSGSYNLTTNLYSNNPTDSSIPAETVEIIPPQTAASTAVLAYRNDYGQPYQTPQRNGILYLKLTASAAVSGDQTWFGVLTIRSTDS